MSKGNRLLLGLGFLLVLVLFGSDVPDAAACGGLFCQNSPVDQNAERIIFTDNGDGTISAIIQIQYTGFAPDFSWILPLPTPITADDIAVPETGNEAFLELERLTNPRIIPPPVPDSCEEILFELAEEASADDVEVFASGEVGPFGFDVIGSENPDALIVWLRDNEYRVTEQMEPLINVYVEEQFVFLAMRLLPDQGVQEIKPVQVTYASERPMIPLRLTAVAANPDMAVLTWFFAENQVVPSNYAHMDIPDEDLRFFYPFGGNNYRRLIGQKANQFAGQAFVTEYAGPSANFAFTDPLLIQLAQEHPYLTRLNTVISPEEMTVDPVFEYDPTLPDVSNVRDLSDIDKDLYECERVEGYEESSGSIINLPFFGNDDDSDSNTASSGSNGVDESTNESEEGVTGRTALVLIAVLVLGGLLVLVVLAIAGAAILRSRG